MDKGKPAGKSTPIGPEDVPLSERIKKLEDMGIIEALPHKSRKKLPPPIPVQNDIAQTFLKEDRKESAE